MADDETRDEDELPRVCRLFPLPGVVLFPHAVLPLHIFEPRYRQMTEDALAAGDKLIVLVQLCDEGSGLGLGDPPIERIACVGRILEHERLSDGRFNLLLLGLKRVRLVREVASEALYRLAEVELLADEASGSKDEAVRADLLARFRDVARGLQALGPDLEALLGSALSLGQLTDLLGHALGLPAETKQALLANTSPHGRALVLADILDAMLPPEPNPIQGSRPYPPPFSSN